MYFNMTGDRPNQNTTYNRYGNHSNVYQTNQKSPNEQKPNVTGAFLLVLLVLTFVVMFFHVVNVIDTNNKLKDTQSNSTNKQEVLKEEIPSKNEEITDKKDETADKKDENLTVEEKNKNELIKLCKLVDSNGSYQYEEYLDYINSFDADKLTKKEQYEIMSKKNYCYNGACVKIEKEGIINYVECANDKFFRITFEEYEKLQEDQAMVNISLQAACLNLDKNGDYDSGAAQGFRVKCENYICSLDYEGETITKSCK